MTLKRRDILKTGAGALVGLAGAPMIARAADKQQFHWRMTSAYPSGSPFYSTGPGSASDFVKRVEAASGGRLKIDFYPAGELIPALGGFDAVRGGTVQMNWGNAYFWAGRSFAAQYFTAVPFGMDVMTVNAWLYHGGGQALWDEVYADFGLKALPAGNTGMQMTGWFKKPLEGLESFKGLRMRIPGLAGKVYEQLGVNVKVLPGGEIFPALERGVIDAAEFVGPYLDRQLGLQNAASHYYTPGWHEPSNVSELLINKAAWQQLPDDLKAVVQNCAAACNEISFAWCNANNAAALNDLTQNQGVTVHQLPEGVLPKLRELTMDTLSTHAAEDQQVAKVHKAYFDFKKQAKGWLDVSEKVVLNENL
ncbi:TRAP transporter substrate-binding protein [Kushneria phosphatilytica]|uniref:TRAP transporter substrate-binding protein n=1 Tax=Kushneria phosphatilytica TaxID=657387 RepID=A0A5C1A2P8_9GAMM|nr:TRAP transporter substrate-binding protein [Kushneria phosphatilytica]QEL12436.1 TRAP transporter substrate-binding protein [Kushneria phosphatilytica]